MAHVSHRLKGAFEGALAGGGDPATSPLYVFGPFLKLLVVSGVGAVSFGTPIWLVVATVVVVSLMYRHVMTWITDGSGGSGLCEEEFGGWAVKVNASITAIEYTLTFLVSLAALVTFAADRLGGLGRWERTALAVVLTIAVGVVVNRGPRLAARVFGPATAAVLALLWLLVFAVVWQRGLHLPSLSLEAFAAPNLHTTLGGYVRLLALMTGIEVFANLVAAYDGSPEQRARQAFGSLLIVMVTTLVTMVVVGPAIYALADPAREDVSVFTQTMDHLLPAPVAWAGTLIGIIVLLSAAAASAQGLQNLSLGLRHRHYVPASFGQRNRFDVADRPVLLQVLVVAACFVAFGTHEETYLSLYAAGVFVLLGLTGWASVKRLFRQWRQRTSSLGSVSATVAAAAVTSAAAALIFFERFTDGAWTYLVLVPGLYVVFTTYRGRLGSPTPVEERLGRLLSEKKSFVTVATPGWPQQVLAVIDGTQVSEGALVAGAQLARALGAPLTVCLVSGAPEAEVAEYLAVLAGAFAPRATRRCDEGETLEVARAEAAELIVAARRFKTLKELSRATVAPLLIVHDGEGPRGRYPTPARVLVALDGSRDAEATLPHAARFLAAGARVTLVAVPDGDMGAPTLEAYVERVAASLRPHGAVEVVVGGSGPARTLVEKAAQANADLVIVGARGTGGAGRSATVPLGSVPERLLTELECSLLIVPTARPVDPVPAQAAEAAAVG